ncbi:MAG: hypothetical protein ABWY20_24620 [Mycobacterium sp.]
MTAEEQKTYDQIMAKGRDVADAVKAHRHDQEVFAFARELSDNVIGGLSHDELSSSGSGSKSRRLSARAWAHKVATQMLGPDGQKALAPSGATIVGQEFVRDPVALGQIATSLLDVLPPKQYVTAEYAYLRQTVRAPTTPPWWPRVLPNRPASTPCDPHRAVARRRRAPVRGHPALLAARQ